MKYESTIGKAIGKVIAERDLAIEALKSMIVSCGGEGCPVSWNSKETCYITCGSDECIALHLKKAGE